MDAPGTIFYLKPVNKYAAAIMADPANRDRRCSVPHIDPDGEVLRIGLDQQLKNPPYLVQFGRREYNDVILNNRFSRNDQCYFDFNKDTGELLLHDISEKNDTELCDIVTVTDKHGKQKEEPGAPQIWKTPRQCVVGLNPNPYCNPDGSVIERQWIFIMRDAEFRLIPRRTRGQDEPTFTEERRAFAGKPDPEEDDQIRSTKLRPLGRGGQGEVYKVVDMYTGAHHACKIVAVKARVPQWRIYSERDFRARVKMEVKLVQALAHVSSRILDLLASR